MACTSSIRFLPLVPWLALTSCAHHADNATPNRQTYEEMRAETDRAFELERQADLVIVYKDRSGFEIWTPGQERATVASRKELAAAIADATSKRELAVVIIGKVAWTPEPQLGKKVDEIEATVKAQGFARVVIQLASSFGRPIYRE